MKSSFNNKELDKKEILYLNKKKFFEEIYKLGNKRTEKGYFWRREGASKYEIDFLKLVKKTKKRGNVLDLGCGEGRMAIFFAQNGFKGFGIDFSYNAIKQAKEIAKKNSISNRTNFKVHDVLEKLPFSNNFFDVAIDSGCFHNIENSEWETYVKNLIRVLKKDAFYMVAVAKYSKKVNIENFLKKRIAFVINSLNIRRQKIFFLHYYTLREINEIFTKNFEILKIKEITYINPKTGRKYDFYNIQMKMKKYK